MDQFSREEAGRALPSLPEDPASLRRKVGTPALLAALVALTVSVFLPVGGHEFILFDDDACITGNPWVRQGITAASLRWACSSVGYAANWYPLTWLSHQLDVELFGLAPRGHHFMNLWLHAAAAALLFLALLRLIGFRWRSALVAALFAVHPLHVESVAWMAERKDVLSAGFWSLALLLYAGYVRRPGPFRYLAVLLAFAAGLMSKPMTVTLPFVLLLLDWWPLGRLAVWHVPGSPASGKLSLARAVVEKTPFFALSAAASAVAYAAQSSGGGVSAFEPIPLQARAANALWSCAIYLKKAILPSDLAIFYPHPGTALPWSKAGAAAMLLAALTATVFALRRRRPALVVGWLWYLGTLIPVLGLVQFGAQALADRYTYLPLTGVFLALVLHPPVDRGAARWVRCTAGAGALAVVAACALMTRAQLGYWRNNHTVFARALAVTEGNWMAENFVGISLLEEGRPAAAESHFARAIALRPSYWRAFYNLGNSLLAQDLPDSAVAAYRQAILLRPNWAPALNNLGVAFLKKGDVEEARRWFREALRVQPGFSDALSNLEGLAHGR